MNIRNAKTIACTLALAALAACGSNPTTSTTNTSVNNTTANTTTATPAPAVKEAAATPTEAARHVFDAIRNKDIAAVKVYLHQKDSCNDGRHGEKAQPIA